ncbi:MAG: hypothetical protein ISP90_09555 [Nevskia sp.]|nr:hypothetical protein [Nevskia sp.]
MDGYLEHTRVFWGRGGWLLPALALLAAPSVRAAGWGGSLAATSDYVFRGLTLSDNRPSLQGDLHYYAEAGWYAGLWAASVRRSPEASASAELNLYGGHAWRLADSWTAKLGYVHYAYPGIAPRSRYDYDEFNGALAYRGRVFAGLAVSPDAAAESRYGSVTGRTVPTYWLALHQPLPLAVSFNAGAGYRDMQWLLHGGYWYWNAGLAYDFGHASFDLSYIGAGGQARALFYEGAVADRWVGTLAWHF